MSMEIISKKTTDIKPYRNNPRKNDEAVEGVAASIREFGFKVPIVIDKNGIIVAGDTRFKAAKSLKLKEVPCIVADDLSDEQIKAFRLADNKVAEVSEWDFDLLKFELEKISFDMKPFGFEFDLDEPEVDKHKGKNDDDDGYYGDERERTNRAYNLELLDHVYLTSDKWQIPIIYTDDIIPDKVIGFNYALTSEDKNAGVHFYLDDYQFERVWNYPEKYIEALKEYECVFSPDFSLYLDMPIPMKIWNVYRSRLIGAYYQSQGVRVIPTVSWAEEATFDFAFKGIPTGGIVSVSTIGVKQDELALEIWKHGMKEMIKQIKPKTILIYGGKLDFDYGNIEVIYLQNEVLERWKENS